LVFVFLLMQFSARVPQIYRSIARLNAFAGPLFFVKQITPIHVFFFFSP
jgi:hypothetical protein